LQRPCSMGFQSSGIGNDNSVRLQQVLPKAIKLTIGVLA